mmetsp:Transcript_23395/g.45620  ORF Transcript_23395/g.45620 Transcript_23395/m.45620 type:complete len:87 (+) Transcript_23395:210-470(+)
MPSSLMALIEYKCGDAVQQATSMHKPQDETSGGTFYRKNRMGRASHPYVILNDVRFWKCNCVKTFKGAARRKMNTLPYPYFDLNNL